MPAPHLGRSIWSIVAAIIVVTILSLGTDELFHLLGVYPPWGQPMWETKLNALALSYRLVYDTFGSYLTARLAPYQPLRHVFWGAHVALLLSLLGAAGAIAMKAGPVWYPVALALSVYPTAWLGGRLYQMGQRTA